MPRRHLPESVYNWITLLGALLAAGSLCCILLVLLIDLVVAEPAPYLGLLAFVVLPVALLFGLGLVPVGMLRSRRRVARGEDPGLLHRIRFDASEPRHRNALVVFALGSLVLTFLSAVGAYQAYRQTESVEFCGLLCHSVMHPEYTTYSTSPHARVACVECHIGAGADWFARSKLSGAYQVYAVLANVYSRPIPTPVENLRPARETCEQCHWPEKFHGQRLLVGEHFLGDEGNRPYPITMLLNTGGGSSRGGRVEGIHWHVDRRIRIEYAARDRQRQQIAWVRLTEADGSVVEYRLAGDSLTVSERTAAGTRTMDCVDCHNRPSHRYRSANRTVNEALARGWLDRDLPFVKYQAVAALDGSYEDTPSALVEMERQLTAYYEDEYPEEYAERRAAVDQAVATVQRIYTENCFPEMRVTWRQYPDHIGHSEYPGCFRCHGSELETADGGRISRDCNLCHTILAQGEDAAAGRLSPQGLSFVHPEDIGGEEFEAACTECHEGGAEIY